MSKLRKGEVKIYKGEKYIAIPEIKEESCEGCCFYNEGVCSIEHNNDPNCLHSGMIWTQEENGMSDIILMIGDASGKEGQFSDSDKKTAENFGCEYMDVDDFVDKYKG